MSANDLRNDGATKKSTTEEIRQRFDNDVERFANLETGQSSTVDAPLTMALITEAAVACNPDARRLLDIGCGAGNNTLKFLESLHAEATKSGKIFPEPFCCDLLDLSRPMLDRAESRIRETNGETVKLRTFHGDFREADLPENTYDVILAAAVLHHLRDDADWEAAFCKIYRLLAPGGSLWITDYVAHESAPVSQMMDSRYGKYLESIGGEEYRDRVLAYIAKEDTPRPVSWQLELMRRVGFVETDILHKNGCFAAFGGRKK